MTRGDVYWADLLPRSGSEQRGRRPVVIVSHDAFNQIEAWRSFIVVPLTTSSRQARRGPTVVRIEAGTAGLERSSTALCHQPTTIDRSTLSSRIGRLPESIMRRLDAGLVAAMDLLAQPR